MITDLVEKPVPGSAPSRWIVIGRYVCDPVVFDILRETPPGRGGEIQLTDALKVLAGKGELRGVLFNGRRLRHRKQAGLPPHHGDVRRRAGRPGQRVHPVAAQVPRRAAVTAGHGHDGPFIPVEQYQSAILAAITPLPPVSVTLADAEGCVLAEDVTAAISLPSFDNSGMDGYAVHAKDTISSSERAPTTLQVTSEIAAGDTGAYRIVTRDRQQDHDRRADAGRRGRCRAGGVDRRRHRPGAGLPPGRAWQRGTVRGRRRRRRRDAAVGRGADAADADRGGRVGGAPGGHGPAQAAGRRAVHGQRADRAGHAAGPRPDLGFQQLHARGSRP